MRKESFEEFGHLGIVERRLRFHRFANSFFRFNQVSKRFLICRVYKGGVSITPTHSISAHLAYNLKVVS